MRIATIHVGQETNDFNPLPTTLDDFKAFGLYEGQEIIERMAGKGQVGGCVDAIAASGMNVEWIPIVSGWPAFARSGGMLTYGPNLQDSFRAVARSVDKVLKGARPAELPVEQPTKFELVINTRTARALGIELPSTILARADEVIE